MIPEQKRTKTKNNSSKSYAQEIAKETPSEGIPNPNDKAFFISKLFFLQYVPFIYNSYQKIKKKGRLFIEDIPIVAKAEDGTNHLNDLWDHIQSVTDNGKIMITPKNLNSICWGLFKWKVLFFVVLMTLHGIIQILYGFFLQMLLESLTKKNMVDTYMWAGILCGSIGVDVVIRNQYFYHSIRFGTKFRSALTTILYWKVISLNNYAIQSANLGKLVNIVANDMNNIEFKIVFLPIIVATPFIIAVSIYLLWRVFEWTCLLGLFIFIIL